jgi:hypothetical protein
MGLLGRNIKLNCSVKGATIKIINLLNNTVSCREGEVLIQHDSAAEVEVAYFVLKRELSK